MLCAWIFDHFLAETLHLVDLLVKLAYLWLFSSKGKICYVSLEWSVILIFRILSAKNWITHIIIEFKPRFQYHSITNWVIHNLPDSDKNCHIPVRLNFFFFFFRITNVKSQSNIMILRPFGVSNFLIGRTITRSPIWLAHQVNETCRYLGMWQAKPQVRRAIVQ